MGEMGNVYGTLAHNILFRGGDAGNDSAILLHSCGDDTVEYDADESEDNGTRRMVKINCSNMIGTSGVFQGKV